MVRVGIFFVGLLIFFPGAGVLERGASRRWHRVSDAPMASDMTHKPLGVVRSGPTAFSPHTASPVASARCEGW